MTSRDSRPMISFQMIGAGPNSSYRTLKVILTFTVSVIVSWGLYYAVAVHERGTDGRRPNIIVIMADDLGWNDVSFHGANQIATPNIDALAYYGVILQRHYVLPICTPSRTAFLTGRYPIRSGMQGYPLKAGEARAIPLNNTLLPAHLKKLGYATHLVGKWHVGYYEDKYTPAYRGFDTFLGYYNGYISYFNHTIEQDNHVGHDLHYDIPGHLSPKYKYEYMTDLISERAEDIILGHDQSKPLYLQLSHLAPHSSDAKEVMEVRDAKYVNETLGYIGNFNRRKFAGVVTAMDESIGRVVRALNQANMLENSIIVFMSDNGAQTEGLLENYGSNYPLRGLKFTLFEGGIRGTACIYSPLIKNPSRVINKLIHITDWLPTLYSAAGGNLNDLREDLDGVEQWSTITSEKGKDKRKSVLLNIDEVSNTSAALMKRYKLIKGATALYGDYYGDSGADKSYPEYNISSILHSPTGSAIASISNYKLDANKISQLRKKAMVVCKNFTSYPKCFDKCLFDIYTDPCETTDLSSKYPYIVDEIDSYIEQYYKVLIHQTNVSPDPASYPEHFNGTWMPWVKSSENEILTEITVQNWYETFPSLFLCLLPRMKKVFFSRSKTFRVTCLFLYFYLLLHSKDATSVCIYFTFMAAKSIISDLMETCLRLTGLWPNCSYKILKCGILMTVLLTFVILEYWYCIIHVKTESMVDQLDKLSIAFTNTVVFVKFVAICIKQRVLAETLAIMAEDWNDLEQFDSEIMIQKAALSARITKITLMLFFPTVPFYTATIFLGPSNNTTEKKFLLAMNFPFESTKSPVYEIIVSVQVIAEWIFAIIAGMFMALSTTFVIHVAARIDVITEKLKQDLDSRNEKEARLTSMRNIIVKHERVISLSENIENLFTMIALAQFLLDITVICFISFVLVTSLDTGQFFTILSRTFSYYLSMNFEALILCYTGEYLTTKVIHAAARIEIIAEKLKQDLDSRNEKEVRLTSMRGIIVKHERVIVLSENIESLFTMVALAQFLYDIIVMCFIGFVLVTSLDTGQFFTVLSRTFSYYLAINFEALILCYTGEYLTTKSEYVGWVVYNSNWYDWSVQETRALLLIILRSQKSLTLTIGKFTTLSLVTFANINSYIEEYYKVLIHQTNVSSDPASYPEHFNGTWMPWVKSSENEILTEAI
ncbi:uncharacterized protein LOC108626689 [Ceratina calcarata]|uniref:Uncharacterized protein LOC108626689 n=1 Tax=Ceratina calcarata TaxID=156304 RepID=A0AAJ7J255_9HYME|nr:uncharacterized protein LOC108626689 [Ceratina calcarata]